METAININEMGPTLGPMVVLGFILFASVIAIVSITITLLIWCRIAKKTGHPWALGLLMLVPVANFVFLCLLAFTEWPIQKELQAYKSAHTNNQH